MNEKREPQSSEPIPGPSSNAEPGPMSGQPSADPHSHLKPHERHLMGELVRLGHYLDGIPDGPDGKPVWTPEEREFLAASERLEGRPLTEPEKRLRVAQARMIGDLPRP